MKKKASDLVNEERPVDDIDGVQVDVDIKPEVRNDFVDPVDIKDLPIGYHDLPVSIYAFFKSCLFLHLFIYVLLLCFLILMFLQALHIHTHNTIGEGMGY